MKTRNEQPDFSTCILGETREHLSFDTRDTNRLATLRMAEQARHTIRITSRNLESAIYDNTPFYEAAKALILRSQRAHIYILLNSADYIVKNGHRLLGLSQKMTSFIDIRVQAERFNEYNEALMLIDDCGYIRRPLADRYEAEASFNAPRIAMELLKRFEEMWSESETDSNLGRLYI